jgi:hypothetical protein
MYEIIAKDIDDNEYARENVSNSAAGKEDLEKRKRRLVKVVQDARLVLQGVNGIRVKRELRRRADMLQRILGENIMTDKEGQDRERGYKEKPADILVSPVDEDARYGVKSPTKRFTGYKASVTESVENRFITNIEVIRGNRPDGDSTVRMVIEQKKNGLVPKKLIGDSAYGNGMYRKLLNDNGTTLIAPLREVCGPSQKVYPKSMFHYDEKTGTLTCPQKVKANMCFKDSRHGQKQFHFPIGACTRCAVKSKCTTAKEGRRTVSISMFNKELRMAEKYNQTERFKEDMKLRPAIEGKLSELTRYHGLRRARYRGLKKVQLQGYFTAAVVNIKRWIKILCDKLKPDKKIGFSF